MKINEKIKNSKNGRYRNNIFSIELNSDNTDG